MSSGASGLSATFFGLVEDAYDAMLLISATRLGLLPRITRRLYDAERKLLIHSGSVFVWCVEESGIQRWRDGLSWSASRIEGETFLLYREMKGQGDGRTLTAAAPEMRRPPSDESTERAHFRDRVRSLTGSLLNVGELDQLDQFHSSGLSLSNDNFKRGGLMKQTFRLHLPGEKWRFTAYYKIEDAVFGQLSRPIHSPLFESMALKDIPREIVAAYGRGLPRKDSGQASADLPKFAFSSPSTHDTPGTPLGFPSMLTAKDGDHGHMVSSCDESYPFEPSASHPNVEEDSSMFIPSLPFDFFSDTDDGWNRQVA